MRQAASSLEGPYGWTDAPPVLSVGRSLSGHSSSSRLSNKSAGPMLTIRSEQMRALGLARAVRAAQAKAADYGLTTERDLYRFVNLCASVGLDFDLRPDTSWMRQALVDPLITSPSERLRVLTSTWLHRAAIEAENAAIAAPAVPTQPDWMR